MFDSWAKDMSDATLTNDEWQQFRSNMYDGEFLLNVDEAFVRQCETPMLVLIGDDLYHPHSKSREIAALAPLRNRNKSSAAEDCEFHVTIYS